MNFGLISGNISSQLADAIYALSGNIEQDHQRHTNNLNKIIARKQARVNKVETERNNNLANKNAAIANLNGISSFIETHYKTVVQLTNHSYGYINDLSDNITNISFTNDIAKTYQLYKHSTLSTTYKNWYEIKRWNIQYQQPTEISGFTTFLSGNIGKFGPNYQTNVTTYVNDLKPHLVYFCTIYQSKYGNNTPVYTFYPPTYTDKSTININDNNINISNTLKTKILSSLNKHKKHILLADANRDQLKTYLYVTIPNYIGIKSVSEKQNVGQVVNKLTAMYNSCKIAEYKYKNKNNDQIIIQQLYQITGGN